jgi:hypothetical protein
MMATQPLLLFVGVAVGIGWTEVGATPGQCDQVHGNSAFRLGSNACAVMLTTHFLQWWVAPWTPLAGTASTEYGANSM